MNFISIKFLALFIVLYVFYWNVSLKKKRILLIIASCIFYSFFSFNFLIHLIFIILINFLMIKYFLQKEVFVKLIVGVNLFNLILFKYFYFVLELIGQIFGIGVLSEKTELNRYFSSLLNLKVFELVLPATISYYTFQFISLGVDLKKKVISEKVEFFDIASYILFLPVMIAGPILRYKDIRSQFENPTMNEKDMADGLWLILVGIVKKILLSDLIALSIYPVFSKPADYSGLSLLYTSYFFAFHLYLDFSGLTDMARGIGKLLGFSLPENFKAPFFLSNFGDFWRRWHLTFSFWIRDYIYIPLGGSRKGELRTSFNLLITFILGGLWHGASLNFALWGFLTGIFLSIERFFGNLQFMEKIPKIPYLSFGLKYFFVLHIYLISWVLFFTPDVKTALLVMKNIAIMKKGLELTALETGFYVGVFTFLFHSVQEWPDAFRKFEKYKYRILPFGYILVLLVMISNQSGNLDFFYAKF
ncbi:MAG: MBOAT family protein [Leptospiraceae bacterium]|nr:MBOAT family protein [Leptospiraceae bacterium]MCK6380247.1 MBOAT family protein [Leptospiraceae bacterium]NUM40910.1 MBOAT family protein [Leptospiraceae bacterium]